MNKQQEALRLALEALEDARTELCEWSSDVNREDYNNPRLNDAITAIRDALAEPEEKYRYGTPLLDAMTGNAEQPAPPPECQTEAEKTAFAFGWWKALEMHRTPAQQQEPVVWMYINRSTHETSFQKQMRSFVDHSQWKEVPLYSEPLANHEFQCVCGAVWCGDEMVHLPDKRPQPSKPLTDEEIDNAVWHLGFGQLSPREVARAIEAAHGITGETK